MVFNLIYILGKNISVYGGNEEYFNGSLKVVDFSILSSFSNIESYHYDIRDFFTTSSMWYGVGAFVGIQIILLPIACMCKILLKMGLFSCRFVRFILISLWDRWCEHYWWVPDFGGCFLPYVWTRRNKFLTTTVKILRDENSPKNSYIRLYVQIFK